MALVGEGVPSPADVMCSRVGQDRMAVLSRRVTPPLSKETRKKEWGEVLHE